MATVIGNDYDHIDISNGTDTARHMLKDAAARDGIDSLSYDVLRNKIAASTSKTQTGNPIEIGDALPQTTDKVVIGLEPQQDLHGYDKPWVGGAGKNVLKPRGAWSTTSSGITFTFADDGVITLSGTATQNNTQNLTGSSTDTNKLYLPAGTYVVSAENFGANSFIGVNVNATSGSYDAASNIAGSTFTVTDGDYVYVKIRIESGATFNNTVVHPMIRLSSISDASWEPYSNICPITGYDSVDVVRTGKNLFPGIISRKTLDDNTGEETSTTSNSITTFIRVIPNTSYALSGRTTTTGAVRFFEYDANKAHIGNSQVPSFSNNVLVITTGSNTHYIRMRASVTVLVAANEYQFEKGSTATVFEPYQGQTVSVNVQSIASGTVYGGTVTINEDGTGTLVVDRAYNKGSQLTWSKSNSTSDAFIASAGFDSHIITSENAFIGETSYGYDKVTYPVLATAGLDRVISWRAYNQGTNYGFMIRDSGLDSYYQNFNLSTFQQAVDNLDIVYAITPQSYTLTASQVTTLLGYNRIYTNGDTLEVTYRTDKYATKDEAYGAYATDTASGAVASFSDGADDIPLKTLTAVINPVQDLHGYDKPWVGGAGTNLSPITIESIKSASSSLTWDGNSATSNGITFTILTDSGDNVIGINVNGTSTGTAVLNLYDISSLPLTVGETYRMNGLWANGSSTTFKHDLIYGSSGVAGVDITQTTGTTFTFSEEIGSSTRFRERLVIYSGQTISNQTFYPMIAEYDSSTIADYAPYSNICPISGWDEANVTRTGKNLFDPNNVEDFSSLFTSAVRHGHRFDVPNNYKIIVDSEGTYTYYKVVNSDLSDFNSMTGIMVSPGNSATPTVASGKVMFVYIDPTNVQKFNSIYVGYGNSGSYEPYKGKTLSVNLKSATGSTVYGGTLTINSDGSGTVVVDRGMATENTFGVVTSGSTMGHYANADNTGAKYVGTDSSSIYCNMAPADNASGWNRDYPTVQAGGVEGRLRVYGSFTTLAEFKQQFAGLQICYLLTTPITYTLTATQLRTLLGANNVWADTGNVSVVYRADPGELFDNVDDLNSYINSPLKRLFPEDVTSTQLDYASLWDGEHTFKLQLTIMRATTPSGARYGARMEWVPDV